MSSVLALQMLMCLLRNPPTGEGANPHPSAAIATTQDTLPNGASALGGGDGWEIH
jgi:hypothetical protein